MLGTCRIAPDDFGSHNMHTGGRGQNNGLIHGWASAEKYKKVNQPIAVTPAIDMADSCQ
jgi:hypothetical protein